MIDLINNYLLDEIKAIKVERDWIKINSVYAAKQGIYGFVEYQTEQELIENWESCSYELATKIQARLPESIDNLRWDIYLIYLLNDSISPLIRKIIENDRRFFKKIVMSKKEMDLNRLPFMFDFSSKKDNVETVIHQDKIFLESLNNLLSEKGRRVLGEKLFELDDKFDSDKIYQVLNQKEEVK